MGTLEKNAVFTSRDDAGNMVLMYPITRKEAVYDLEDATNEEAGLMSASDKDRLDNIPTKGLECINTLLKQDGVGWYFEETEENPPYVKPRQMYFSITEDDVDVTTDTTKGVAPYSTSYGYTNITIHDDTGLEWVEGAVYNFVINTKLVVASATRNVRIRIGESGAWIPVMNSSGTILAGNSYFLKNVNYLYHYSTKYQAGGALHVEYDANSTYNNIQNILAAGALKIDPNGYGARYSLVFPTTPLTDFDEKFSSLVTTSNHLTTKAVPNLTFYIDRHPQYIASANIAAGAVSAHATYQDCNAMDLRYTVNTNNTYLSPLKKVFLWLKDFNQSTMTFKADATNGNIMTIDKIATRFPASVTGDVYLYFLGWTNANWYQLNTNFTQLTRIYKYTPSTKSFVGCNILAG